MVKQLWPYIEGYVEQLLRDTVEPAVQNALPSYLKSFQFEKIKLGRYVSTHYWQNVNEIKLKVVDPILGPI